MCINNLKQGLVWQFYCDDNDGKFSNGDKVGWARGEWPHWKILAQQDILLCPAANMARDRNGESYRLIKVPKYKHDQYAVFGSQRFYRHGHIGGQRNPHALQLRQQQLAHNARRTIRTAT